MVKKSSVSSVALALSIVNDCPVALFKKKKKLNLLHTGVVSGAKRGHDNDDKLT